MKRNTSTKKREQRMSAGGWFVSEPFVEEVPKTSLAEMLRKESKRKKSSRKKEEKKKKKKSKKRESEESNDDVGETDETGKAEKETDQPDDSGNSQPHSHAERAARIQQELDQTGSTRSSNIAAAQCRAEVLTTALDKEDTTFQAQAKQSGFGKHMRSLASLFTWKGRDTPDDTTLAQVPTLTVEADTQSESGRDKNEPKPSSSESRLTLKHRNHNHSLNLNRNRNSMSDTQLTHKTSSETTPSIPSRHSSVKHREELMSWEADRRRPGVKGRLVEVVHGYAHDDPAQPRTLVVFEWRLIPGLYGDRIKRVRILVAFEKDGDGGETPPEEDVGDAGDAGDADNDNNDDDNEFEAVPIKWSPDMPIMSLFSTTTVTASGGQELNTQAGYTPLASVGAKLHYDTAQTLERIDARCIRGVPLVYGPRVKKYPLGGDGGRVVPNNAVQWQLEENAALKSGVQYNVRTAVLLRRRPYDMRPFRLTVCAEANLTRTKDLVRTALTAMKVIRSGSGEDRAATALDPSVVPGSGAGGAEDENVAARPTRRDWRNLQNENLDAVLVRDTELAAVMAQATGALQQPPQEPALALPEAHAPLALTNGATATTTAQYGIFGPAQMPAIAIAINTDAGGGGETAERGEGATTLARGRGSSKEQDARTW